MVRLAEAIERGFPDSKHNIPQDLQEYHRYRHSLHTINGVICYKGRLVIPSRLRLKNMPNNRLANSGLATYISE